MKDNNIFKKFCNYFTEIKDEANKRSLISELPILIENDKVRCYPNMKEYYMCMKASHDMNDLHSLYIMDYEEIYILVDKGILTDSKDYYTYSSNLDDTIDNYLIRRQKILSTHQNDKPFTFTFKY